VTTQPNSEKGSSNKLFGYKYSQRLANIFACDIDIKVPVCDIDIKVPVCDVDSKMPVCDIDIKGMHSIQLIKSKTILFPLFNYYVVIFQYLQLVLKQPSAK